MHLRYEFDKNADSINVNASNACYIELVWRLSEFAFFVRLLRWAHFLFYGVFFVAKRIIDSNFAMRLRTAIYPLSILLSKTKVKYKIEIQNEYISINDKPIIFACNHSAFPDIPIALRAINKHCYTLIGKQNLAFADKIFFFLSGAIWVDRKDKTDTLKTKQRIIEYLKKNKSVLWFPEATWNLTDNLLMLPMRWGIIEVAQMANAKIIPMAIDYDKDKMLCRISFGEPFVAEDFTKQQGIINLRNIMATLRWDFISEQKSKRNELDIHKEQEKLFQAVYDYPPLNWDYEKSCIYQFPNTTKYENAFVHLKEIKPTMQNAFLFNKGLKG